VHHTFVLHVMFSALAYYGNTDITHLNLVKLSSNVR
jgi:hypothetical protein